MKRIALLFLFIPIFAFGQISLNEKESFGNEVIRLGNISSGGAVNAIGLIGSALSGEYYEEGDEHILYCRIFKDKITIGIGVKTANSFDDDMEIALGTDFQTTDKSLQDIIDWDARSAKGVSTSFTDIDGRKVQLSKKSNGFYVKVARNTNSNIIVGDVTLTSKNLKRAQSLLNESNYRKIKNKLVELGLSDHPFIAGTLKDWEINTNYLIHESPETIQAQIANVKDYLKKYKKEKNTEMVKALQYQQELLSAKKSIASLMNENLHSQHPEYINSLVKSAISAIENGLESKDSVIVESAFASLHRYELEFNGLTTSQKSKIEALYDAYKEK